MLVALAVLLMGLDLQVRLSHQLHRAVHAVLTPLYYLIDQPVKFSHQLRHNLSTREALTSENAQLRAREIFLQAKLSRMALTQQENQQLRRLLSSSARSGGDFIVAEIMAVELTRLQQKVIINQGLRAGVYEGQPVLDAYGVMGQVIEVGPLTSTVMLLTDANSAIPVESKRTGQRAIIVGTGSNGMLQLEHVPDTSQFQTGELLLTSGLGLMYPTGYPVGRIQAITHTSEDFATILVAPAAHLHRTRLVLLVWPSKSVIQQEALSRIEKLQHLQARVGV